MIDGKCGGLTVSIGARVSAIAGPSEVVVSQTVKDLVAGSGLTFEDAGEHELKGVPDRWHLYRVVGRDGSPETRYATAPDGTSIAYQVVGGGPVDLVYACGIWSNIELMWEGPRWRHFLERLASFSG